MDPRHCQKSFSILSAADMETAPACSGLPAACCGRGGVSHVLLTRRDSLLLAKVGEGQCGKEHGRPLCSSLGVDRQRQRLRSRTPSEQVPGNIFESRRKEGTGRAGHQLEQQEV